MKNVHLPTALLSLVLALIALTVPAAPLQAQVAGGGQQAEAKAKELALQQGSVQSEDEAAQIARSLADAFGPREDTEGLLARVEEMSRQNPGKADAIAAAATAFVPTPDFAVRVARVAASAAPSSAAAIAGAVAGAVPSAAAAVAGAVAAAVPAAAVSVAQSVAEAVPSQEAAIAQAVINNAPNADQAAVNQAAQQGAAAGQQNGGVGGPGAGGQGGVNLPSGASGGGGGGSGGTPASR